MKLFQFWQSKQLAEHYQNNVALVEQESSREISYQDLYQLTDSICNELIAKAQTKLLIVIKSFANIHVISWYLALLKSNHTVWMVDKNISEEKLKALVTHYHVDAVITQQSINWQAQRSLTKNKASIDQELALVLSTSGSTSSTKLVKLSYENLMSNSHAICQALPINNDDCTLTTLPLHYSFGLSVLHSHLLSGACLILTDASMLNRKFWDTFQHYKATSLYGVPYQFEMLAKLGVNRLPITLLKYLAVAGGKLPEDKVLAFATWCQQNNKKLYVMYGQTEATARISYLSPQKALLKPGSIGQAITGGKLWLIDSQGKVINSSHSQGELCYQGPNVMKGYATDRNDFSCQHSPPFLATGDVAYFDQDGDFYITGRLKRFIKIQGHRINLDEVEQLIAKQFQFEFIDKILCVGEDDLLICVCANSGEKKLKETAIKFDALKKTVSDMLSIHSQFIRCHAIESLPLLSSGKFDYQMIKAMINRNGE